MAGSGMLLRTRICLTQTHRVVKATRPQFDGFTVRPVYGYPTGKTYAPVQRAYHSPKRSGQRDKAMSYPLADHHREALKQSAICGTVAQARGYRTVTDDAELQRLGFAPGQCRVPGLLLPLHATDGSQSVFVFRPDDPRVVE